MKTIAKRLHVETISNESVNTDYSAISFNSLNVSFNERGKDRLDVLFCVMFFFQSSTLVKAEFTFGDGRG